MADLETLMGIVKTKINDMIAKPKMTEKLLAKPPFRFLHDTITAVCNTTGFAEGLYNESELDSAAITEKNAKIAYLEKIFTVVGICKGVALEVKAAKVVSGLEPELTNLFLIDFADCANNGQLDSAAAVARCLAGEQPGDRPPPLRNNPATSLAAESKTSESSHSGSKPDSDSKGSGGGGGAKAVDIDQPVPERGKSRGGTRGGKPNLATADVGLSGFGNAQPSFDAEIEKCDGSDAATQMLLGELIQKPKLTEKLLAKPPFRFLHDIIMEVMRVTGFATGLYTPTEMDSAAVVEKTQKMLFLEKIIKVVGTQLNTMVEAKPAKIVAGLDAPVTNNFLQLLAVAAKLAPNSTNAVRRVLEELGEAPPSGGAAEEAKPQQQQQQQQQQPAAEEKRSESSRPQVSRQNAAVAEPKAAVEDNRREISAAAEEKEPARQQFSSNEDGENDNENKRSSRPMSARRRPPKVKDGAKEVQGKDIAPVVKKAEGIILDGTADEEEEEAIPEFKTLAEDLKPDAKNVAKGKIERDMENLLNEQKALENINNNKAAAAAASPSAAEEKKSSAEEENRGTGIRISSRPTKRGKTNEKTSVSPNDRNSGAAGGAAVPESNLDKMRASIQVLVQHTGPLGTCMDYIQEDISLMTSELHKWEEECRKYEGEYEESKRKTKEVLHPLKVELADIEDQIIEQMAKTSSLKATIARNDDKIQQILKLIATA